MSYFDDDNHNIGDNHTSDSSNGSESQGSNGSGNPNSSYNSGWANPDQPGYGPLSGSPEQSGSQNGRSDTNASYGGNEQYKWNYDDYQKALTKENLSNNNNGMKGKKKRNKGLVAFIISICSVFAVALVGLAGVGVLDLVNRNNSTAGTSSSTSSAKARSGPSLTIADTPSSSTTQPLGGQLSTNQIFTKVSPSVVGIIAYDLQSVGNTSQGTGIIMSSDGYIVTNEHVIDGADKVAVVLSGKTERDAIDATVVGKDTRSDLAVLKINKTGLKAATFGDSSKMQVGDTVIAIGNPGGLEFADTLTQGVISAINRSVTSSTNYTQKLIQTDASINPGNSGGPLVNSYGQVIGITSSKISSTNYEGMGFAIPSDSFQPIVNDIIKYGYVTGRVKIGISVSEFSAYEAKVYNMQPGLLISSVDGASDAAKQGLKKNDVITKINGKEVTDYNSLYTEESKYKAGQTVTLTIYRSNGGSSSTFDVKVKLMEDKGDTSTTTSQNKSQDDQGSGQFDQNGGYGFFGDN